MIAWLRRRLALRRLAAAERWIYEAIEWIRENDPEWRPALERIRAVLVAEDPADAAYVRRVLEAVHRELDGAGERAGLTR